MTLMPAITSGDLSGLPTRRDEDWRWTDLRGLIREKPEISLPAEARGAGAFDALADEVLTVVNKGAAALVVPARATRTVALRLVSRADGTAHDQKVSLSVGEGATLVLLETHEGDGAGYFTETRLDITLEPGASLTRVVIASEAEDAIAVSLANVHMSPKASYAQTVLTTGAKRERLETHIAHPGHGAHARLDGAYLSYGKRHTDQTTVLTHADVGGTSEQLVKGAAAGQGRGVFQGRIIVEKGADQTDARMGHHALILDDTAEVDAKPELLIFADDVQCTHGNTVGQLDEQAVFYARQRGIPEAEARAMLTAAFVGEVVERIEHEGAREIAREWAAENMRGLT